MTASPLSLSACLSLLLLRSSRRRATERDGSLWKRAADTSVSADLATCSILNTAPLLYLMKMVKFLFAVQLTRSGS